MKNKSKVFLILVIVIIIAGIGTCLYIYKRNDNQIIISKLENMISGTWQAEVKFPDWKGYIDDTLAMNSMYSFDGVKDQGKVYFKIDSKVETFDLFINNKRIDTNEMKNGIYEIDISKIATNGKNTIQVSNIMPNNIEEAIMVNVPYPRVINGNLEEVGLSKEPFDLIDDIITSDINNGFTSAQMAVIKE